MQQFGGKDTKRHFTVVMEGKEHGLYVSSTPSSAAKKAVTKLCVANKSKKVEFHIREITQGSKKKTYGPYDGYIEKLKEPIELKGRIIKYKPIAKLSGKVSKKMKGGMLVKGRLLEGKELTDFKKILLKKLIHIAEEVIKIKLNRFKQGKNDKLIGEPYNPEQNDIEFLKTLIDEDEILKNIFNEDLLRIFDEAMYESAEDNAYKFTKNYTNNNIQELIIKTEHGPKQFVKDFIDNIKEIN
jgi:hypothetical protein